MMAGRVKRRPVPWRQAVAAGLTNLLGCGLFAGLFWVLAHRVPWG